MKIHILHKWSKWSKPIESYNSGHKQQWRFCKECNKVVFRTLPWDKQTLLKSILESLKDIKEEK